jgi:hypothetical protein
MRHRRQLVNCHTLGHRGSNLVNEFTAHRADARSTENFT